MVVYVPSYSPEAVAEFTCRDDLDPVKIIPTDVKGILDCDRKSEHWKHVTLFTNNFFTVERYISC